MRYTNPRLLYFTLLRAAVTAVKIQCVDTGLRAILHCCFSFAQIIYLFVVMIPPANFIEIRLVGLFS